MIYGLVFTYRHRLPAAPGPFQPMIQRLITKLLEPEVWLHWRDLSRGGSVFDAHPGDLAEEWNPVVCDNIMYSAYVKSDMVLHDYLFIVDRYAQPESLAFRHWSFFWGGAQENCTYDRDSLNEHLHRLMGTVRRGRRRLRTGLADFGPARCRRALQHHDVPQLVVSDTCDFGSVAAWVSEVGDQTTMGGLLAPCPSHVPTWPDGGLCYPAIADADGRRTEIEPMSGNVLLGYAQVDIPGGLWGLYQQPWHPDHFTEPRNHLVDRIVDVSGAEVVDGVVHARLRGTPSPQNTLERDGMVTRSQAEHDRRAVWLTLTAAGDDTIARSGHTTNGSRHGRRPCPSQSRRP